MCNGFVLMILLPWWNDTLREANVFNTSQMGKNYQYHIIITKYFRHFFRALVIDDILKSEFFLKKKSPYIGEEFYIFILISGLKLFL